MKCADEMNSGGMTYMQRRSSNIKVLPRQFERLMLVLLMGFMMYAAEMGSGGTKYRRSSMTIVSCI
jgi:hypothetical protein